MNPKYENDTRRRLAEITDAGRFEELATAVLREADERCRRMAHVGVNAEGKTIKSPLDAIVYVSAAGERHLVAVHHTTSRKEALRGKWLSNPDSDLNKTLREFTTQRETVPDLGATLILTTNNEPGVQLLHDVEKAGREAGIEIKVWSGSALAHFLDVDPNGQWIRKTYLGVVPSRLSKELLGELSARSVALAPVQEDPEHWVEREVDAKLSSPASDRIQFVLGNSGVGKSIACLKCLQQHVQGGGFGLVVTEGVVESSLTVEEAIERTLRSLQPSLADGAGSEALSLSSQNNEFILVVEDVNAAAQPARLIEKIATWGTRARIERDGRRWRILCPVWPRTLALASGKADKVANEAAVSVASFTRKEGIAAVKKRRLRVTDLEAEAVATALGFDPLLIALHESTDIPPEPETVIQLYIEREVRRVAAADGSYTASEYRGALRVLALETLKRGQLEPTFSDVVKWTAEAPSIAAMLRDLARYREVFRLDENAQCQQVRFRHDRVRDHLLAEAIKDAISRDALPAKVMSEPYFAEVIGMAIANSGVPSEVVDKIVELNPLALFCALRHCSTPNVDPAKHLVWKANRWAEKCDWGDQSNDALRFAVLRVLAECDGRHIGTLCKMIGQDSLDQWSLRGRFRNGDLYAGVLLCAQLPPGFGWAGHVELIGHVVEKGGSRLIVALGDVLRNRDLSGPGRRGALRLAGFVASPELAGALRESWVSATSRQKLLRDYFWACAQCCDDDPDGLLEPVVDAWAAMPDEDDDGFGSPRVRFGARELRWAFRDLVPERAIDYFLRRARGPELRWPLLVMLHGVDNPDAVEFVVKELAEQEERLEETGHFSPFAVTAVDEWGGRQIQPSSKRHSARYGGDPMSATSRERLAELWSSDALGTHLRRWALRFWSATVRGEDIPILRTIDVKSELGNLALFERLRRGDRMAIPELAEKLGGERSGYWWQAGRYLWSEELTDCLDRALARRADELKDGGGDETRDPDWILAELLTELPPRTAERLITEHWTGLRHSSYYVHVALYVASPGLLASVAKAVAAADDPKSLFEYLSFSWGHRVDGRNGVTRRAQVEGLLPYLEYLSEWDITMLWDACNKNSWFDCRRQHLDSRVIAMGKRFADDAAAIRELDHELEREGSLFAMDHWGEMFLETGVSIDHMMEVVAHWVSDRDQEKALSIAADLVTRFGNRRHAELLQRHKLAESQFGVEVIENAKFEIRLRSLE